MDGAALQISDDSPQLRAITGTSCETAPDDPAARLEYVFQHCRLPLFRFIVLRVSDRHAAEDLLQQTCYEAARKRHMPVDHDAAQAWLFGIARNLLRRHFRHQRRQSRPGNHANPHATLSLAATPIANSPPPTEGDLRPLLFPAMATLSHADQELLLGCYFEGRSQEQLAREMGVSVRAIEGRLYRARQSLREALQKLLEGSRP